MSSKFHLPQKRPLKISKSSLGQRRNKAMPTLMTLLVSNRRKQHKKPFNFAGILLLPLPTFIPSCKKKSIFGHFLIVAIYDTPILFTLEHTRSPVWCHIKRSCESIVYNVCRWLHTIQNPFFAFPLSPFKRQISIIYFNTTFIYNLIKDLNKFSNFHI